MDATLKSALRTQLEHRRDRIGGIIEQVGEAEDLVSLLHTVDAALERMDGDNAGLCGVCGLQIYESDLRAHPAIEYCLCNLSEQQQRALERDLGMARRLQLSLLPEQPAEVNGWEVHHRYLPAGMVSGDYCDLIRRNGTAYAALGDVSGKGVAAAFLMAQLNGTLRSLVEQDPPLRELIASANRFFAQASAGSHFATLVCARLDEDGAVEFCNAGHCPPLVLRPGGVSDIDSSGFPVGIMEAAAYETHHTRLAGGESLVLYSDGVTEAQSPSGELFGEARLRATLSAARSQPPAKLIARCLADLATFQAGRPHDDDVTVMVIRRM
jgi:sigma-B regulation protein RsbU (phosphoserine phosphatase)